MASTTAAQAKFNDWAKTVTTANSDAAAVAQATADEARRMALMNAVIATADRHASAEQRESDMAAHAAALLAVKNGAEDGQKANAAAVEAAGATEGAFKKIAKAAQDANAAAAASAAAAAALNKE